MRYYITRDNNSGGREIINEIDGSLDDARKSFDEAISAQSKKYHIDKTLNHWQVLRLFDENDNQIAQES